MSDWWHKMKRSFYPWRSGFVAASFLFCVLGAAVVFLLMPAVAADEHSSVSLVLELSLDGEVEPILATYIDEGLADAARRHAALVLITQDAMAFLRSFTDRRGRNPELAEKAITESKAFTEKEALDGKMIDLIVSAPDDLLRQLDGRTIKRFDGTQVPLVLKSPVRTPFALSARQKFLARIVQPDAFFVLLILGVLGLYTEFTHPGVIAPGVIGGICLILALYAMNFLPVNLAGLFLIALALAFFILEAKAPSHGILAFGGVVSMFLGAIFL